MAFKEYISKVRRSSSKPTVLLSGKQVRFHIAAIRLLELKEKTHVKYHIDEEERKIGFEFKTFTEEVSDRKHFLLRKDYSTHEPKKPKKGKTTPPLPKPTEPILKTLKSISSKIGGLIADFPWIKKVVYKVVYKLDSKNKLEAKNSHSDIENRRFELKKDPNSKIWFIQLCPSFENSVTIDDYKKIPAECRGIYHYLDSEETIIYIGKGKIRDQLNSGDRRENWGIAQIEYSEIKDEKEQFKWERYWIERFKASHNGRRPYHNKNDGHSSTD